MTIPRVFSAVAVLALVGTTAALWWLTATVFEASSVLLELVTRALEESP